MTVEYRDETPFTGDNHTPTELANAIRTKKYGKDVREPIAQLADKLSNAVLGQNIGSVVATPTKAFDNLAELQKTYPTGADGVMVTVDNGHKYFWKDNQWKDFGVYQSVGTGYIADVGTITPDGTSGLYLGNADNAKKDSMYSLLGTSKNVINLPDGVSNASTNLLFTYAINIQFNFS